MSSEQFGTLRSRSGADRTTSGLSVNIRRTSGRFGEIQHQFWALPVFSEIFGSLPVPSEKFGMRSGHFRSLRITSGPFGTLREVRAQIPAFSKHFRSVRNPSAPSGPHRVVLSTTSGLIGPLPAGEKHFGTLRFNSEPPESLRKTSEPFGHFRQPNAAQQRPLADNAVITP